MAKRVIYNGGTESYGSCSDPSVLTVGKEYEIVSVKVYNWHTDYKLKGIDGTFNSVWFNEVTNEKVYIAIAKSLPKIGEKFDCYKLDVKQREYTSWSTSPVRGIELLGNNIYKVKTCNSIYLVSVITSEVIEDDKVYMAIAKSLPVIGSRYECEKLETNPTKFVGWSTSPVKEVKKLGNNIYEVTTLNSVYIVNVFC